MRFSNELYRDVVRLEYVIPHGIVTTRVYIFRKRDDNIVVMRIDGSVSTQEWKRPYIMVFRDIKSCFSNTVITEGPKR